MAWNTAVVDSQGLAFGGGWVDLLVDLARAACKLTTSSQVVDVAVYSNCFEPLGRRTYLARANAYTRLGKI